MWLLRARTRNPSSIMDRSPLVIAIDGPAGAGKSTVTREVARRLGMLYLDTGAMYRAATVGLYDAGIDPEDPDAIADYVCQRAISFDQAGDVLLDGVSLGQRIRTPETTAQVWRVANNPGCREHLVRLQQEIVGNRDVVVEGRDATTVICPQAPLKVYLDASPEERARRRMAEWQAKGEKTGSLEALIEDIKERDARDFGRHVGPLTLADDAFHLLTDGMGPLQVVTTIIAQAIRRRPLHLDEKLHDQVQVGRSRQPGYVRVAQGSITEPPAPWQLGLTNPTPERMPGQVTHFARNVGGRQAGVLLQGPRIYCCGRNR